VLKELNGTINDDIKALMGLISNYITNQAIGGKIITGAFFPPLSKAFFLPSAFYF